MNKVILKAEDLDGFLTRRDRENLVAMDGLYRETAEYFSGLAAAEAAGSVPGNEGLAEERKQREKTLIRLYNQMGKKMQEICAKEPNIQVYSFVMPPESQSEASRLISKLRDARTENQEFVYYIQRAYELLFKLAYIGDAQSNGAGKMDKNYFIIKTPVTSPVQNYAVHKITNVDKAIENTVMCVMLRGSLLPSMIMSKEIQEYSSHGYVTPFALFKIKRDDRKQEYDMEYILDLDRSYFDISRLDGKDLVFADPMNATGGSLVTVVKYLLEQGVKPNSVQFFNVISALKGALRSVRALDNCRVYTLWMDPMLNQAASILPGLGDAGDRINGRDAEENPRNIIQLIADYGANIAGLYREQLREIEATVLGRRH
jgi:uracil phosphoribosyltransferase